MTHATHSTPRYQMVLTAEGTVFIDRQFQGADKFDALNLGRAVLNEAFNYDTFAVRVTRDVNGNVSVFNGPPTIGA